jgi:hypothetical protein
MRKFTFIEKSVGNLSYLHALDFKRELSALSLHFFTDNQGVTDKCNGANVH